MSILLSEESELELLEKHFSSKQNFANNLIIRNLNKGSRGSKPNIPESLKPIIGAVAKADGISAAARYFGVSRPTVQKLKEETEANPSDIVTQVESKQVAVQNRTIDMLMGTLGIVQDKIIEDLDNAKVKSRDYASVARDLSLIHKNLNIEKDSSKTPSVVIINAPKLRSEADFKVIEVKDETGT